MKINPSFDFFQIVYKAIDPDQNQYIITSMQLMPGGIILYGLDDSAGSLVYLYAEEISATKDYSKA